MTRIALFASALLFTACVAPPEHAFSPFESDPLTPTHQKVYRNSECVGPIINSQCHGAIIPQSAVHPTCYGTWLNGICTGPMF